MTLIRETFSRLSQPREACSFPREEYLLLSTDIAWFTATLSPTALHFSLLGSFSSKMQFREFIRSLVSRRNIQNNSRCRLEKNSAKTLYFECFPLSDESDFVMTSISVGSLQNFAHKQQLVTIIETDNTRNNYEPICSFASSFFHVLSQSEYQHDCQIFTEKLNYLIVDLFKYFPLRSENQHARDNRPVRHQLAEWRRSIEREKRDVVNGKTERRLRNIYTHTPTTMRLIPQWIFEQRQLS